MDRTSSRSRTTRTTRRFAAVVVGGLSALSLASMSTASAVVAPPVAPISVAGYWGDSYGGLHAFASDGTAKPLAAVISAYGPNSARGVLSLGESAGGYLLSGDGSLNPFSVNNIVLPVGAIDQHTYPGADVARGAAMLPDKSGGYWVDSAGGLHSFAFPTFAAPAAATLSFYSPGRARGVIMAQDGKGGYVLDNGGSLHPFTVGPVQSTTNPTGNVMPAPAIDTQTFGTADVARGFALLADNSGGYWLDSAGGLHPFALPTHTAPAAAHLTFYAANSARGVIFGSSGTGGFVLDKGGNIHAFAVGTNPVPAVADNPDNSGAGDVARTIFSV
jgi:hypothetical protein